MAVPADRFNAAGRQASLLNLPAQRDAGPDRSGPTWITRRVGANGVISVAWQQSSVGKHSAGELVDVHVDGKLLQVWHRDELLKTIVRDEPKEVRKKRAAKAR
jgi:hypothetical protein